MLAFISHSEKDTAIYSALCLALDGAGMERWDQVTLSLGEPLADQLRKAIRKCDACVFVATRQSVVSRWCLAELGAFWGAGKRILLFKGDSSLGDDDLPPQFKGSLWTNDAPALLTALSRGSEAQSRLGDKPANLFWLGHDLARAIRFAMFEPGARDELEKGLRQALHHLAETGLSAPDARTVLVTAIRTHRSGEALSEEERRGFVSAIAKAKNELGNALEAAQPGFRAYPTIDDMRGLDEEFKKV